MQQRRAAFTLIEMLVAMALTLFIMVIISTTFISGLETFRQMKGIGDMNQNLRMATQRLRADLLADHFDGKRLLSDTNHAAKGPIRQGFFRIVQSSPPGPPLSTLPPAVPPAPPLAPVPYQIEGIDQDSAKGASDSRRAVDHWLHFSMKMRGDRAQDFFTATIAIGSGPGSYLTPPGPGPGAGPGPRDPMPFDPGSPNFKQTTFFSQPTDAVFQANPNLYSSQWAEIAYYLVKIGTTSVPDDPTDVTGIPLYGLYRMQRVVVPRNEDLTAVVHMNQAIFYQEFSAQPEVFPPPVPPNPPSLPQWMEFNNPENLAQPTNNPDPTKAAKRSFMPATMPVPSPLPSSALVLNNMISFQVQGSNGGEPFHDLSFDSSVTLQRLTAIQITLRIWDPATQQTRQITLVQDM